MSDLFSHLMDAIRHTAPSEPQPSPNATHDHVQASQPGTLLGTLELGDSTLAALSDLGFTTVEQLQEYSHVELLMKPGITPVIMDAIRRAFPSNIDSPREALSGGDETDEPIPQLDDSTPQNDQPTPSDNQAPLSPEEIREQWLGLSIDQLDLSVRSRNALVRAKILTVGDLCARSIDDLLQVRNLGRQSLDDITTALLRVGLHLQDVDHSKVAEEPPPLPPPSEAEIDDTTSTLDWKDCPLDRLDLSVRSGNALRRAKVTTIGQLVKMKPEQLLSIRTLGTTSLEDIQRALTHFFAELSVSPSASLSVANDDDPLDGLAPELLGRPAKSVTDANPLLDEPVNILGLVGRPANALEKAGITTLRQLCGQSPAELLFTKTLGTGSLNTIRQALSQYGLHLAGDGIWLPPEPKGPLPDAKSLAHWLDIYWSDLEYRQQLILLLRLGLDGQGERTLEQVGEALGITRERVRQIENKACDRIVHPLCRRKLQRLMDFYPQIVQALGGVARLSDIASALSERYPPRGIDPLSFLRMTLPLSKEVVEWDDGRWALGSTDQRQYRWVESTLQAILVEFEGPIRVNELISRLSDQNSYFTQWNRPLVDACLKSSPVFFVSSNGWVFLQEWLSHGGKSAWLLAALHDIGHPAHFTEITARVNGLVPEFDLAERNVHAMISRLPTVERTGPGTFGLKRWGFGADKTIVELLEEALNHFGGATPVDRLTSYVLERKDCEEGSVRSYLENDPRFLRLRRNVYTLANRVTPDTDIAHLTFLRSIPLQPDWILIVLEELARCGRLSLDDLQVYLADMRQAMRLSSYVDYLLSYGWAERGPQGVLTPTDLTKNLMTIRNPSERLLQFAMTNPNFQTYLCLVFVEHLLTLEWAGESARVASLLQAEWSELRRIHEVMRARVLRGIASGSTEEDRHLHLLHTVRAPGIPQVFVRWVEPVFGCNTLPQTTLWNRLIHRVGQFPSFPSTLPLDMLSGDSTKLLILAFALAGASGRAVDFNSLGTFASELGFEWSSLEALSAELLVCGLIVDDRQPYNLKLMSPVTVLLRPDDFGTESFASLQELEEILTRRRVLVPDISGNCVGADVRAVVSEPLGLSLIDSTPPVSSRETERPT